MARWLRDCQRKRQAIASRVDRDSRSSRPRSAWSRSGGARVPSPAWSYLSNAFMSTLNRDWSVTRASRSATRRRERANHWIVTSSWSSSSPPACSVAEFVPSVLPAAAAAATAGTISITADASTTRPSTRLKRWSRGKSGFRFRGALFTCLLSASGAGGRPEPLAICSRISAVSTTRPPGRKRLPNQSPSFVSRSAADSRSGQQGSCSPLASSLGSRRAAESRLMSARASERHNAAIVLDAATSEGAQAAA
mmetsp:Transcript_40426/g.92813  ORF Transcript_40426/g.92813 Transcript_40426/m.92813 type:complete len:251 (-) Transcript_40426:1551-2303(-)